MRDVGGGTLRKTQVLKDGWPKTSASGTSDHRSWRDLRAVRCGALLLLHSEEGLDCLVVFGVFRPADEARLTAIVTFERYMQSVFGYPNDEAYWHDPPARQPTGRTTASSRSSNRAALLHRLPRRLGEFLAEGMRIELTSGVTEKPRGRWRHRPDSGRPRPPGCGRPIRTWAVLGVCAIG